MRVPSKLQITFKNIKITRQSKLRFTAIYITENLKLGVHDQLLRAKLCKVVYIIKNLKETMGPYMVRNVYYSNFH
jgi:hypothetical protein